jgi:hypothetical protein
LKPFLQYVDVVDVGKGGGNNKKKKSCIKNPAQILPEMPGAIPCATASTRAL